MAADCAAWDSYLWEPGGSVLRNLFGLRDKADLARAEFAEANAQQALVEEGLLSIPKTYDAAHVKALHRQLFGNIYEWAGEYRTVPIYKDQFGFAELDDIPRYLEDAGRIIDELDWSELDIDQFAAAAAEVFAYVNHAHPFREGNGRASKLFMQHVSELSRFEIDYDPATSGVTAAMWNEGSRFSGPDRFSYEPVPDSLVPVFRALAAER
ncbi:MULTISPECIES: Fic family protein [unclassified Pseudoclavibacter]|uniref:Fic/DOC family protein n=1 Tax=unclassified Pseudoclavibacter TaxID=2615177 RepID=UPI000CE786B0|nr:MULTISPECIES: Fic family protein [unclassified Pseudoclavibacter]MBF4550713.1 Fic family protein [Pseudoclavibacter sp. VKM Ac-2888]PPF77995.1 cell filamentation protein Fic [Pseudoclavibacter sp. Z016]